MLEQLIHSGVVVPEPPPYRGLTIQVRGETVQLIPHQEEMALAWARKQGTPYVSDPVFVQNFMADFCKALGMNSSLSAQEIDFAAVVRVVEREREAKARLTREERKAQAAKRKAIREEIKEKYGHAVVNGERVELGGYVVEPSGIFMGRGEHPLRGRWKQGANRRDITLNLSPGVPCPEGDWAAIVWQPESLWVARWQDKLSGKLKYIWLSDTAPIKQEREAAKFAKALELHDKLDLVREQIQAGLRDPRPRQRMVAMACYLIDALCLRVGDEKDADEADTVGATTLRPEHVTLHSDGIAEFHFLGKDSVELHKELELPPLVYETLAELIRTARPPNLTNGKGQGHPTRDLPQLFPDVSSRSVNAFLSRIHEGLSAKVFRTHHATQVVVESLEASGVEAGDPEYKKWRAVVMANLEAAILCNHTKKATGNWETKEQRFQERLEKAKARRQKYLAQVNEREEAFQVLLVEAAVSRSIARSAVGKVDAADKARLERAEAKYERVKARYEKKITRAKERLKTCKGRVERASLAIGKIKAQREVATHKRTWNLGTSLKSYIDPRVYHRWGQKVGYDVIERYYPRALRRKFAWAKGQPVGIDPVNDS